MTTRVLAIYYKKRLSPDIDQVANAYARKFNWRIEVSGESALNLLGPFYTNTRAVCLPE
ncbi:MAG: hypothetical protein V9G21_01245 [Methylotenera sp.]